MQSKAEATVDLIEIKDNIVSFLKLPATGSVYDKDLEEQQRENFERHCQRQIEVGKAKLIDLILSSTDEPIKKIWTLTPILYSSIIGAFLSHSNTKRNALFSSWTKINEKRIRISDRTLESNICNVERTFYEFKMIDSISNSFKGEVFYVSLNCSGFRHCVENYIYALRDIQDSLKDIEQYKSITYGMIDAYIKVLEEYLEKARRVMW